MLEDPNIDELDPESDLFGGKEGSERLNALARITVMHPDFKRAVKAVTRCFKSFGTGGESICVSVLGNQGCGKTHIANRFLRRYPESRTNGQLIKPVLRVRVPSDPTIKGVSTAILDQYHDPNSARGSEQEMAGRIDYLAKKCRTRLIIVEEVHHFVDAERHKRNIKVANWLKIRIEETGVPFMIDGLPRTEVLFKEDDQLRERFDGPCWLKPFIWFEQGIEPVLADKPFRSYVHFLSKSLPFKDCIDFGAGDNALRLFYMSRGIPRRIGKLLKQAAMLAEEDNSETVDLNLLGRAYATRMCSEVPEHSNPFSPDFDLEKAEGQLKAEAKRPSKKYGEGVVGK